MNAGQGYIHKKQADYSAYELRHSHLCSNPKISNYLFLDYGNLIVFFSDKDLHDKYKHTSVYLTPNTQRLANIPCK